TGSGVPEPVVRRITPGTATDDALATERMPSPTSLAAGMRLTDKERALVDRLLPDITNREREVLFEIVAGGTNERVAERMGVKLPTLRTHLMRLNQKLGSTSKSDLVRLVTQAIVLDYRSRLFGTMEPMGEAPDDG
ncbi:MAG: helix-turn-helix transcriptional regulator, partial [Planctomycetota bacterium]